MDSKAAYGVLERKIDLTIERLDQMLLQISGYKPLLEHNAHCAESEIKANFDGLIEALTQRRLLLTTQLRRVCEEKLTLIANQKQAVESLRSGIISCIPNRYSSDSRIHDFLARAESAAFSSSSAPFVSFRSERSILPQAIANYGKVISRYCGHFADPGQPSSCLPLAFEEEDDHELPHNCESSCECLKSTVRQVPQNLCQRKSHGKPCNDNDGNKSAASLFNSKSNSEPLTGSPVIFNHHGSMKNSYESGDACAMQSALLTEPCTFFLRNWLDSRELPKTRSLLNSSRKLSNAFGSNNSESTYDAESGSFTVLTDSVAPQPGSLNDWLFCDPLDLQTGFPLRSKYCLSAKPPSQNDDVKLSEDLSIWLAPSVPTVSPKFTSPISDSHPKDTTPSNSSNHAATHLPSYLTQSGPIDLIKWLRRDMPSPRPPVTIENLKAEPQPSPTEMADVSIEELITDSAVPECCIYSQCRGGPGGPTCCGARMQCDQAKRNLRGLSSDVAAVNTPTAADLQPATGVSNAPDISEPKSLVATHPVVAQLKQIANSDLSQWLKLDGESTAKTVNQGCVQHKGWSAAFSGDTTDASPMETFGDVDESVSPAKRRNVFSKVDPRAAFESVQSPNSADGCKLACPSHHSADGAPESLLSESQKSCDKTAHNYATQNSDMLWLSRKLSNLSTRGVHSTSLQALDEWLVPSPAPLLR
ncbi:unnamed protein product [Dicrocoelium dendriticum]|nr:unnamed protein product [Dicrocoelium dendriticum]